MALSLELERATPGTHGTLFSYTITEDEEDVGSLLGILHGDHFQVHSVNFSDKGPGVGKLRELLRKLKEEFPQVRTIGGFRTSGAKHIEGEDFRRFTQVDI